MANTQILIVEDELIIAKNLERQLRKLSYEVVDMVSTAKDAVAAVQKYKPDLVLMDIMLKGGETGLDAAKTIQNLYGVPIIYVTAFTDPSTLEQVHNIGGYGFIPKPFTPAQLDAAIRTALGQHSRMQALQKQATTDALTGVANRGSFLACADRFMDRGKRYQENFSVLMFDIDHFKSVNDTYGHDGGDFVLQSMTAIVQQGLRRSDHFGRLGGEEFAAILAHASLEQSSVIAQRILEKIADTPLNYGSQTFHITTSIGLACYKSTDTNFALLLKRADQALYQAKKNGRNRLEILD